MWDALEAVQVDLVAPKQLQGVARPVWRPDLPLTPFGWFGGRGALAGPRCLVERRNPTRGEPSKPRQAY